MHACASHVGFMLLLTPYMFRSTWAMNMDGLSHSWGVNRTFEAICCPHAAKAVKTSISVRRYRSIGWSRTMHRSGGALPYTRALWRPEW